MKTALWVLLCGVCFWLGLARGVETRPPGVPYITKVDNNPRCELWEKFKKREARRM